MGRGRGGPIVEPLLRRASAYPSLFLGLVLVSTSGPFIKLAAMDAYVLVALRTGIASLLFFAIAAARGELAIPRAHGRRLAWGSLLLGAHFLLWVKAFDLTDFASNLLLLVAQPLIAVLLGLRMGDRPTRYTWLALLLATAGLAVIAGGDFALGPRALAGDAMCIAAGLLIALFYVTTREARAELPIATFMAVTMGGAAALALPVALAASDRIIRYSASSWGWLAGLVFVTTMGGHGVLNFAARHVSLFSLNIVIILEPALGIAIGALLFGARVTALQAAGGALLAVAVVLGLRHPPVTEPSAPRSADPSRDPQAPR